MKNVLIAIIALLGLVMIFLGIKGMILPPAITGLGFIAIAMMFQQMRKKSNRSHWFSFSSSFPNLYSAYKSKADAFLSLIASLKSFVLYFQREDVSVLSIVKARTTDQRLDVLR